MCSIEKGLIEIVKIYKIAWHPFGFRSKIDLKGITEMVF